MGQFILAILIFTTLSNSNENITKYSYRTSDPLGQEKRLEKSYPVEIIKTIPNLNKNDMKLLIKRIQFALKTRGKYRGGISGILDNNTTNAIMSFQKQNMLTTNPVLNEETLTALGVTIK